MTRPRWRLLLRVLCVLCLASASSLALPALAASMRTCTRDSQDRCVTPDPTLTPGALDPRVTQATIQETICGKGYAATVRPSFTESTRLKYTVLARYGIPWSAHQEYEMDHLVPLELGGDPADLRNLWPEPWTGPEGAHAKDVLENTLHRAVCADRVPLATAQACLIFDWRACWEEVR